MVYNKDKEIDKDYGKYLNFLKLSIKKQRISHYVESEIWEKEEHQICCYMEMEE
jgi:hypothetical protein